MRIATWNVNSVNARLPTVLAWMEQANPDVACFQEIKCVDEKFPREAFESLGYNVETHGQKSYNGVALLSKHPMSDIRQVQRGLEGDPDDLHSRYLEVDVFGTRIACIYLPNGNPVGTDKFGYKLAWMERLRAHAEELLAEERPVVVLGDFNVIPHDDDVWSVKAMADDALMQPESRAAYARLLADGWTDAIRTHNPRGGVWTYWDYQAGAWQRDHGFRIDHILLSPECADRLEACGVDKAYRGREKASDHTPVWVKIRT